MRKPSNFHLCKSARILFVLLTTFFSFQSLAIAAPKNKTKPATDDDTFLYRGMGGTFVCNARKAEIDYPKAVGVAATTYVQVLEGKHGGIVKSVSRKKLEREQLFTGAEFQIVTASIQFCPELVPEDVKEKVQKTIQNQLEKSKDK